MGFEQFFQHQVRKKQRMKIIPFLEQMPGGFPVFAGSKSPVFDVI